MNSLFALVVIAWVVIGYPVGNKKYRELRNQGVRPKPALAKAFAAGFLAPIELIKNWSSK